MKFKLFDKERDHKFLKRIGIAIIILACVLIIKDEILWNVGYYDDLTGELTENNSHYEEWSYEDCNVAIIDLKGYMDIEEYEEGYVGSSDVVWMIENADGDDNIKAIILDVDSSGGYPVAGEEISNALSRASKPSVALIRNSGISAAYWASTGADVIFASKNSDIGSIGVTMSYLDYAKQNQLDGLTYNSLSSGKFKDTGNPDKYLSYEEKQYLMRNVDITLDNFVKTVAEKRDLTIEKVRKLADGSSMMGEMALENGLIDYIGDLYDVKQYLGDLVEEEVVICE